MSHELKNYLLSKNVATCRTTPYNPQGNGQCEKLNGTLWKAVTLALKSRNLPQSCWQDVLPDALHSIRSLLCTATNSTPHERMFLFQRRSTSGTSLPTWLTEEKTALLRKHVRTSKQDPLVEEVDLLTVNPQYAHVRTRDGREKTVSLQHLSHPGTQTLQPQVHQPEPEPAGNDIIIPERADLPVPSVPSEPVREMTPGPLMGDRGQLWCNLNQDNIIEGGRCRTKR